MRLARRCYAALVTLPLAGVLAFGSNGPAHAVDGIDVGAALEELALDDLDADVVDEVADIVEDADPTDDDSTLDEAIEEWEYQAPEWRSIPEELAAQVQACRAADDDDSDASTEPESTVPEDTVPESTVPEDTVPESTESAEEGSDLGDSCGVELQLQLRLNHVEQLSAHLEERLANARGNPAALDAMERIQVRVLTRLSGIGELSDEDAALLEELQMRVSEQVRGNAGGRGNGQSKGNDDQTDDDSTTPDEPVDGDSGDGVTVTNGNGNGNGNGKANSNNGRGRP